MRAGEGRSLVGRSVDRLSHRGPDASHVLAGQGYAIGHSRLSVIDLSGSQQPMVCPSSRYFLSFNGEIYNYKALRKTLETRWAFSTEGDTEVVLAGLCLFGVDFLQQLQGMWAIVFWDSHDHQLLLSRDRFGKKPLYYTQGKHVLAAASELPSLKELAPYDCFTESPSMRSHYIKYGYFPPGKTIYHNVFEVLPGAVVQVDCLSGRARENSYWRLSVSGFEGNRSEAGEVFRQKFKDSLARRLVADVDVGVLLSGGVDSSLILSSLVNDFDVKPKTFTVGFSEAGYDERHAAAAIANHFGVTNFSDSLSGLGADAILALMKSSLGQPFGDASILPTALLSKLASKQVKVCLTGDGADEVLSGYQRYQARLMYGFYLSVPRALRAVFEKSLKLLPASHAHHSQSLLRKAQLFIDLANDSLGESYSLGPRVLSLGDEARYFGSALRSVDQDFLTTKRAFGDDVMSMMAEDVNNYLPQDILFKSDRASMASSLDLRSPFLDHELVEFSFSLPRTWHRRGLRGKRILRESMSSYLPDSVWGKRKQGFSVPLGEWFLGALGESFKEHLLVADVETGVRAGFLDMLNDHRARRKNHGIALWSFFTYLVWQTEEAVQWKKH